MLVVGLITSVGNTFELVVDFDRICQLSINWEVFLVYEGCSLDLDYL